MRNYSSSIPGGLTWVQSNGGPLLLLSRAWLPSWNGIRTGATNKLAYDPDSDCDYNRACGIGDYLGLLKIGSGTGLVLGDMPNMTAWWTPKDGHEVAGILVRWGHADNEATILQSLHELPVDIWEPTEINFRSDGGASCLFDSACPGSEVEESESLLIDLPSSSYLISTALYQPDVRTEVLLHVFFVDAKM